ncbi:MAG: hypothetical protein JXQ27_10180 [Acidobacteria bacterium]|nr:hypothetical protein [Acidobacteriota bacterium]
MNIQRSLGLMLLLAAMFVRPHPIAGPAPAGETSPGRVSGEYRVGYVCLADRTSDEDRAAWEWLSSRPGLAAERVRPARILAGNRPATVLWLHCPAGDDWARWEAQPLLPEALAAHLARGGHLLLTGFAARLPHLLGLETRPPRTEWRDIEDNWLFDKKGFHGYGGHPLFRRLFGGTFVLDARRNVRLPVTGYFGADVPQEGRVAAVETSYITLHADRRLVIEHARGGARILSVGGLVLLAEPNGRRSHLEQFLQNALDYLAGRNDEGPVTHWPVTGPRPRLVTDFPAVTPPPTPPPPAAWPTAGPVLTRDPATTNAFDLAGRRALIMGRENAGIAELWVHPFRVVRDYEAGLLLPDGVQWLAEAPCAVEIRPEGLRRTYTTPLGTLTERIFPSLERPGGVIHYTLDATQPARLLFRCRLDLRWMWPYDAGALGDLHYGWDPGRRALQVSNPGGAFCCLVGSTAVPLARLSGPYATIDWAAGALQGTPGDGHEIRHAAVLALDSDNRFTQTVVIVGTDEGLTAAGRAYHALHAAYPVEYQGLVDHYRRLLDEQVRFRTPDAEFDRLWDWTLVGADRFFVTTPRLGSALMAGYATTDRGWDGRQAVSGRPGYAWYFGRDAVWSAFALDDAGNFPLVRQQLEFFQRYQDITGEIFHELSSSGVVHFDSADATPLYVILAAHYLRASGDLAFIRASWPSLRAAMDFMYATDTDHDGLIENTNVGHGWVEGGKLWGAHTTLYLAALWSQALTDAAEMAARLGDEPLRRRYAADAARVRAAINGEFWNEEERFLHYGKRRDGTFMPERTVLPAVAMHFDLLPPDRAADMLRVLAGNEFTADWGVRILGSASPLFNPQGYHYGSVWPLFTGWTALAEYRYGRSAQGYSHILNNLYIKNHWALGFVEEVMNGAVYEPSGVCPHQCWSETNIMHPILAGMVGWRPYAPDGRADIRPQFPRHWDRVEVRNLAVGDTRLAMTMERSADETRFAFSRTGNNSLTIRLWPEIPPGMIIRSIIVDEIPRPLSQRVKRSLLAAPVEIALDKEAVVTLTHTGGLGVVPLMPRPAPGEKGRGLRLLNEQAAGDEYTLELAGPAGGRGRIAVKVFGRQSFRPADTSIVCHVVEGLLWLDVPFPDHESGISRTTVRLLRQADDSGGQSSRPVPTGN